MPEPQTAQLQTARQRDWRTRHDDRTATAPRPAIASRSDIAAPAIGAFLLDTEPTARGRVRQLLEAESDFRVLGESGDARQGIPEIRRLQPDVVFIDAQMPGSSGLEVAEALTNDGQSPLLVFVAAVDEHASRAFERQAFDYLLKPFDHERFGTTLERIRGRLEESRRGSVSRKLESLLDRLQSQHAPEPDRIAVRSGGHVVFVRAGNIDWVEAADNYVCLHCGSETHLLRETMNSIERRLDPARFYRIHRSTIVNADRIKELQPWFRGDYMVLLQSGVKLTMSRTFRQKLQGSLLRNL